MVYQIPLTRVEFELTEACNLFCLFCYNSRNPMICEKPEALIRSLSESGAMELILTGGEPALHPRFFEILEYACSQIPRIMIQSNGTLFADANFRNRLLYYPIFCLNFSLHGPQRIHDVLTDVKGSFDLTIEAIKFIISSKIRLACNMVLTAYNCEPQIIKETVQLLQKLNVKEMTVTRFIPCGIGQQSQHLTLSSNKFIEALNVLKTETSECKISLLLANALPACQVPSTYWELCSRCSFGLDKFYIDVNGNVLICGMSRIKLGNLFEKSLREILMSSTIYERYLEGSHLPLQCQVCDKISFCGGGCRASALASTNRIDGEDQLCFHQKNV